MKKCNCMCNFTEEVQKSSTAIWLFAACSFLFGIIIGFIFAPSKKGIKIGCNNTNIEGASENDLCDYDCDDDDDEIKF